MPSNNSFSSVKVKCFTCLKVIPWKNHLWSVRSPMTKGRTVFICSNNCLKTYEKTYEKTQNERTKNN